ncbi:MAG TPA: alkaline phosphatase family protein [Gemmatimonadaceae bacterium]|nr:alkaline phosphatase family protein [Gemmatimonadaceae bacterium]
MSTAPVLMVGIDATEQRLVDALCDAGELPTLAALRARGCWGPLESRPSGFLSMVWPTFFTGTTVGQHGWYFNKMWRPERMRVEYTLPSWLPQRPFWEELDERYRIALLDVPFSAAPPSHLNGIYLNGWQNHDDFGRQYHPRDLWRRLASEFGSPVMHPELFGAQTARTLLGLRTEMLACTDQMGDVCAALLRRERWDLFLVVLGGAHRGGHYLWDLSQIETRGVAERDLATLRGGCADLYRAWDRALGKMLDAAPPDMRVLAFSLHGMEANAGWGEHFHQIVALLHSRGAAAASTSGLVYRVKRALPWTLVRQVTRRLPSSVNHALVPLWSSRMHDWSRTRYFALPMDLNGYIRVNLEGREPHGIISPGAEYDALCEELCAELHELRDIESGERIVAGVDVVDKVVGADAPRRVLLPDLVVRWADVSARDSSGVRSTHGEVRWARGAPFPSGRSGNHTSRAWFAAAGPGIPALGRLDAHHDILDLVPTAFEWMGAPMSPRFEGVPIAMDRHASASGGA